MEFYTPRATSNEFIELSFYTQMKRKLIIITIVYVVVLYSCSQPRSLSSQCALDVIISGVKETNGYFENNINLGERQMIPKIKLDSKDSTIKMSGAVLDCINNDTICFPRFYLVSKEDNRYRIISEIDVLYSDQGTDFLCDIQWESIKRETFIVVDAIGYQGTVFVIRLYISPRDLGNHAAGRIGKML